MAEFPQRISEIEQKLNDFEYKLTVIDGEIEHRITESPYMHETMKSIENKFENIDKEINNLQD